MGANVVLRFVLLYGVPIADLLRGVSAVSAALEAGALTELPVHRFPLEECAAAHEAVQGGAVGKVLLKVG
jgi:NADPH2:quinone reductase